jgi:cell wall-active antibiotic response 4TMS protein YvqF/B-box zinc finger protein
MNCAVHPQSQAMAYCRTCGKALCEDCKRDVMGAIYCEPCIAARLNAQSAAHGPVVAAPAAPPRPGTPSPVLAACLGCIPGVGAMYNGQFIKAFIHVVIFVLLIIASDSVNGAFGVGIAFWVFYMVFDAYKTAEARRMGVPPPDPLGLDRWFGIHEAQQPPAAATPADATPGPAAAQPVAPQVIAPPPPPQDNAPVGAIVLIALGVMFLLSNNLPSFEAHRVWPLFLIGFGLWIAYKRTSQRA